MFSDHLFTFALSRLTERCYDYPALPVLFGWIDNSQGDCWGQSLKRY
jgi:hypothetical protein